MMTEFSFLDELFLLKAEEEDKYSETERDSERSACVRGGWDFHSVKDKVSDP